MTNTEEQRLDPDKLLHSLKKDEEKNKRGKLKIFFGMCAGVGKTYSMLEAAHKASRAGIDAVIGVIETHKREETEALVNGLEKIPLKAVEYRGTVFYEMDIDAIIARNPAVVLVDELAHTNIPGSRHVKRYQDVIELLNNGINVFTSLNVQHLESRSDTVTQITGAKIRETVPDSIFETADDIELVDITIDELLERLSEGKVYLPEKSQHAMQNFFRKGNLTALREMSLRLTAERVDYQLRDYKIDKDISATWKSGQRLMVAISASPHSLELIRWTKRLAYTMEATWIAVYVDTDPQIYEKNKEQLKKYFDFAEELGAEIITTRDIEIEKALIRVAKENNVSQIILGKSRKKGIFIKSKLLNRLLLETGSIDVYIVGGDPVDRKEDKSAFNMLDYIQSGLMQYAISVGLISLALFISYLLQSQIGYQIVSLILLFVIMLMPLLNLGRGPIVLAALLSSIGWDYFFIPPKYTFHIERVEDIFTLFMFFFVAIVNGVLTSKLRMHEKLVRYREERTNALYLLSKQLAGANGINNVAEVAVQNIKKIFNLEVMIIFGNKDNKLHATPHPASTFLIDDTEWNIAQWVYLNGQKAGRFTNTLPFSNVHYLPLKGSRTIIGVIGIKMGKDEKLSFEQSTLLEAFISQITTTAERELLNKLAKKSLVISESEKLYKTLFSSLSHELKTPITTIIGAVSTMLSDSVIDNKEVKYNLSNEINIAAERLNRLVENLLDMTRLESGQLKLKLEWNDISDLISSVLARLQNETAGHIITSQIKNGPVLFKFDHTLLEQALINIVHNCLVYTPPESKINIFSQCDDHFCKIVITDDGPGFPKDSIDKIFDKFYRVPGTKTGGTGLGLSISKGFIEAHKGSISVKNNDDKGARFTIKIPLVL